MDVWSSNQFLIHASDVMICYKFICSFLFSKRMLGLNCFITIVIIFIFFIVVLKQKHCS